MPKKSRGLEFGQVNLTAYFPSVSQARASSSRKRKPQAATARQNDAAAPGESSKKKGKRKENTSLVTSGSENVYEIPDSPVQDGSSRKHLRANKDDIIDLTDSPMARRTFKYGLYTPVTAPKRRVQPPAEPTPTPTHTRPGQQTHDLVSTPHHAELALATPVATQSPKHALQQPTPATPARSRRMHALPQSLFSPLSPAKKSPRHRFPHDEAPESKIPAMLSESQQVVLSSQSQDINPFEVQDKGGPSKGSDSLFKLPQLPARFEVHRSPSRKPSATSSSPRRSFKMPTSPASASRRRSARLRSTSNEVVPTSQSHEEELIFFSPGRSSNSGSSQIAAASQQGEEELVIPSTPKKRKLDEILTSPSRRNVQEPLPVSPSRREQRLSLIVPSSPHGPFPSTPKRRRVVPNLPEPAQSRTSAPRTSASEELLLTLSLPKTPTRSPDSGHGSSASPEKVVEGSSQTQPESPQWEVKIPPRQPESSQTQPESPQWEVKMQLPLPESSQTQPESPQWEVKTQLPLPESSQTQPESPQWEVKTQLGPPESSQTQPESPQWVVGSPVESQIQSKSPRGLPETQRGPQSPQTQSQSQQRLMESSQTQPESSQWVVRTQPPTSPARPRPRACLEDEDSASSEMGSLPIADYESQGQIEVSSGFNPSEPTRPSMDRDMDMSQSQPWDLDSQDREEMLRKLQFLRRKQGKEDWDGSSDAPLSIPSDYGQDADLEGLGSQDLLATPVKEFLGLR